MSLVVKYADAPLGAQKSAVITATSGQPFSQPETLKNLAADTPWATLEPFGWPLDGSRKLIPDTQGDLGWWSRTCSNADGSFDQPPTLAMTFSQTCTAGGITLSFCPSLGQWCSEVQVLWYRGDTLLDQMMTYPDTTEWVLSHTVENFDKVEIRLLRTNIPGHFAKLRQLQIGEVWSFAGDELVSVHMLTEIDPSLCQLSADTMTVHIRDRKGYILRPQKDQTIQLYRDGMQIAAHYITDATRQSQRNYRIRCQSAIGRLTDTFFGGIYTEYPLPVLLQDVLGEFPFDVDAVFVGRFLSGYLPICTRREALQQIAFAVGAVITTQGDGSIRLVPQPQIISGGFAAGDIFTGAGLKQESAIGSVTLCAHSYIPSEEEKVLLKEKEIHGETLFLTFGEPYCSYRLENGTILASDANWIRLTADGVVTLTGKPYRHEQITLTRKNPQATAAEKGNMIKVEKATLIHRGNADETLERLYRHSLLRSVLSQDVVVNGQYTGQLVESLSPWGESVVGYITNMESTFTNKSHRASIQIRGKEV